MFEKTKSFLQGIASLVMQPTVLRDYSETVSSYREEIGNLKKQRAMLASEVSFHKKMEQLEIVPGKKFFDRENTMDQGPITVCQLFTKKDGRHVIDTDLEEIDAEVFVGKLDEGILVPASEISAEMPHAMTEQEALQALEAAHVKVGQDIFDRDLFDQEYHNSIDLDMVDLEEGYAEDELPSGLVRVEAFEMNPDGFPAGPYLRLALGYVSVDQFLGGLQSGKYAVHDEPMSEMDGPTPEP